MIKKFLYNIRNKYLSVEKARKLGLVIGEDCRFIKVSASTFGSEPYLIEIGNHVTITEGVRFITHDGGVWVLRSSHKNIDFIKPIKVGNNVFIGMNTLILPGVSIGNNTVVGAGTIVTKNLEGNAVYAGVPAKKIKDIDSYENQILKETFDTKGLNKYEKKDYLLRHYQGDTSD